MNFVGDFFFEKNLYIYNFRRAWVENFLAALSKLNSTVPEELFWKSFCFGKSIGSKIFFGLLVTIFWQDFQNWILLFQKKFCEEKFVRKILSYHECSSGFGWNFFGRIVKTAVHNFRRTFFVKPFVWKSYRFISFLRASGKIFFRSLVKTEFYCSRGTLLEKFLFGKNYRILDFLRASGDNFLTGLEKLHSTLPEEHCKRNFFWKKTFISKIFGGLQVKTFPSSCQNCILIYQRNIVGE